MEKRRRKYIPPSNAISESTAYERTHDRADSEDSSEDSLKHRSLSERYQRKHDDGDTGEYTCGAKAGDGAAKNKCDRIWSRAADDGTDLENRDNE